MIDSTEEILDRLVGNIASIQEVSAIGLSGDRTPLPKAGEGDMDVFIYCSNIPSLEDRENAIRKLGANAVDVKMEALSGGRWGKGDFLLINGVETWLMYFTKDEAMADLEDVLSGNQPDKQDNYYYPVARCAMYKKMSILYKGDGFLDNVKDRVAVFNEELARVLAEHHLEALEDVEDLERGVLRKDVLFYHFALDLSLDHFLQALFAINKTFFPSRKRSFEYMEGFSIIPENCSQRLKEVLRLGGFSEGIGESYEMWQKLVAELKEMADI